MGRIRANLHCECFEVLARAAKQRPSWCILDDTTDNSCDCALYLFHACPIILDLGGHTNCKMSEEEMVGTTGFEPATSRTPSVRATRLRYVPTEGHPQGYHRRSRSVKKARSVSRKSSSILRLNSCPGPSAAARGETASCSFAPLRSRKCRRAPAMVNPSSYKSRLMRKTMSTSSWR